MQHRVYPGFVSTNYLLTHSLVSPRPLTRTQTRASTAGPRASGRAWIPVGHTSPVVHPPASPAHTYTLRVAVVRRGTQGPSPSALWDRTARIVHPGWGGRRCRRAAARFASAGGDLLRHFLVVPLSVYCACADPRGAARLIVRGWGSRRDRPVGHGWCRPGILLLARQVYRRCTSGPSAEAQNGCSLHRRGARSE
jgi:hypothetical protein